MEITGKITPFKSRDLTCRNPKSLKETPRSEIAAISATSPYVNSTPSICSNEFDKIQRCTHEVADINNYLIFLCIL